MERMPWKRKKCRFWVRVCVCVWLLRRPSVKGGVGFVFGFVWRVPESIDRQRAGGGGAHMMMMLHRGGRDRSSKGSHGKARARATHLEDLVGQLHALVRELERPLAGLGQNAQEDGGEGDDARLRGLYLLCGIVYMVLYVKYVERG